MCALLIKLLTRLMGLVSVLGTTMSLVVFVSCARQKPVLLENQKSNNSPASDEPDTLKRPIMPLTDLDLKKKSLTLKQASRVVFIVRWNGGRLPQKENPTFKFYRKGENIPFLTTTWADLEALSKNPDPTEGCGTGSLLPKSADMDSVMVCSKALRPLTQIFKIEAIAEKEGIVRTASGLAPVAINNDDAELLALFY
jgi:hypothetical protein